MQLRQEGGQLPPPHKQLQRRRLGGGVAAAGGDDLAADGAGIDKRIADDAEMEDVVHDGAEAFPAWRQGRQLHKRRRLGALGGGAGDADDPDGVHADADKLLLVEVGIVQLAAEPEVVGCVKHVSGVQEEGRLKSRLTIFPMK